jgi:hypothetical protein
MTTRRSEAAAPEWRGWPFKTGGHSQARTAAKDRTATENPRRAEHSPCQLSARAALVKRITTGLARHEDTINLRGHVA